MQHENGIEQSRISDKQLCRQVERMHTLCKQIRREINEIREQTELLIGIHGIRKVGKRPLEPINLWCEPSANFVETVDKLKEGN